SKLARKTNHIERFNNTLRQRVSRLVRAALSFSKKLANHIGAIKLFICHYNLTRVAVESEHYMDITTARRGVVVRIDVSLAQELPTFFVRTLPDPQGRIGLALSEGHHCQNGIRGPYSPSTCASAASAWGSQKVMWLCRKLCSGDREGAVAPVCGGD